MAAAVQPYIDIPFNWTFFPLASTKWAFLMLSWPYFAATPKLCEKKAKQTNPIKANFEKIAYPGPLRE